MRTLTTFNETETQKQITEPFYLVYMGFNTPVYLCSLKDITVDSNAYSGSRTIKVPAIKTDSAGNQTGSIQLSDVDNLVSGLILSEGCAEKAITIYKGYGTPSDADIITEFSGFMDEAKINDISVSIKLLSKNSTRFSPGLTIGKPYFNYLPPAGTIIRSGTTTITLESAN